MQARKVLQGATYSAETVKVMGAAFDAAWEAIRRHFGGDARANDDARRRLAHAVMAVATEDSRDADELKNLALEVMALTAQEVAIDFEALKPAIVRHSPLVARATS